ncbi:DUF1611 domain-containing protein [Terrihabitans soli]|uniref:DUF1611 domain-containing protein n=1 Tax=Terrihabitans soli TaxID=708113 RepID=A0A6S6QY25_9HYPH|nr:molybdopterin-guanine dinucleotide biosynthesis protein MobB [Terrihabitans soli]BCJ91468.1 DUF1611 domain-containing protein [Terrihabitans soli]
MEIFDSRRLASVKQAFSTRRIDLSEARMLLCDRTPRAGDVVLARIDEIGHHETVELKTGRKAPVYPGDEVILAYGDRYAPDQFEAHVPTTLEPCQMVAGGGIASRVIVAHARTRPATSITPIGLLASRPGAPMNVADFAVPAVQPSGRVPIIVVCGTSMNAGKTTSMAALVRGLTAAGLKTGTIKATGTGAGNDLWIMRDSGAAEVLDFTDAGWSTTYRVPVDAIERSAGHLVAAMEAEGCDVIVMEIADGLFQGETRELMQRPSFRETISGVMFAAGDAMGAVGGAQRLAAFGHNVLAVSGRVTQSPLGCREVAQETQLPVYGLAQLSNRETALSFLYKSNQPALETAGVA